MQFKLLSSAAIFLFAISNYLTQSVLFVAVEVNFIPYHDHHVDNERDRSPYSTAFVHFCSKLWETSLPWSRDRQKSWKYRDQSLLSTAVIILHQNFQEQSNHSKKTCTILKIKNASLRFISCNCQRISLEC